MAYGDVNSGDVLLFSSNVPSNSVLKFFTSSSWSHVGIAIRLDKNNNVSKNIEDDLYILEINTKCKYDFILKEETGGVFFSKAKVVFPFYNRINYRKLREEYRTDEFIDSIMNFARKSKNIRFASDCFPLIGAWLGIEIKHSPSNIICSAFAAKFYIDCIKECTHFDDLLGEKLSETENICRPEHYSALYSKKSKYFETKDNELISNREDLISVILLPLIMSFLIVIVIYMTLPQ